MTYNNCCGEKPKAWQKAGTFYIECKTCGNKSSGKNQEDVIKRFNKNAFDNKGPSQGPSQTQDLNPQNLPAYIDSHRNEIMNTVPAYIASDTPMLDRLISNNEKYVMNKKDEKFLKCWSTEEGRESIEKALFESFSLMCFLGTNGDIIPYGEVVSFNPDVEAFNFALTTGSKPPFEWLEITALHKNDFKPVKPEAGVIKYGDTRLESKDGDLILDYDPGIPQGEVVAVVVRGYNVKRGKVIGKVYDADRLKGKAKAHSKPYQYYLQDVALWEKAKSEGKNYIEKWGKKSYTKPSNPWDGADMEEMMMKTAGKSFMRPYIKTRNSEAAMDEIRKEVDSGGDSDDVVSRSINATMKASDDSIIVEYETQEEDNGNNGQRNSGKDRQENENTTETENVENKQSGKNEQEHKKGVEESTEPAEPGTAGEVGEETEEGKNRIGELF